MRHLISAWPEVAERLSKSKHILLLVDYDGTLTPIVETPDLAHLPAETRRVLEALSQSRRFTIGIISGRELCDIKNKVGLPNIIYVGNHGMEIEEVPGIVSINPSAEKARSKLSDLHRKLAEALGSIEGVLVENKGVSLSVHYRLVNEQMVPEVKRTFDRIVSAAQTSGDIRVTFGKKVYEVRPSIALDKGWAVNMLIEKHKTSALNKDLLSIYIGDDQTDEDAFRVINRYNSSMSIFVGQLETGLDSQAQYFLNSPVEVTEFLKMLSKEETGGFLPSL